MKTHEQIVEEVYNNTSYRGEFMSYIKLQNTLRIEETRLTESSAPAPTGVDFISYHDLIAMPIIQSDSLVMVKCKEGIYLLYSSLFRALSVAYGLDVEDVRRLIFGVVDRYSKDLER